MEQPTSKQSLGQLGDLPALQKLASSRNALPKAEPREIRDPEGVFADRLFDLYHACVKHQRTLPEEVRAATKVAIAAFGRLRK